MGSHGKTKTSQVSARALDYFDKFCAADSVESVMSLHEKLCDVIQIKPSPFPNFYPKVMKTLSSSDAQELLLKYGKRASNKNYEHGKASRGSKVLIIGAGPCGLRTAVEAQLMGAKVVVIEKRDSFSRNNVLHLWPFVIADLKGLGAKKFYGKFCPGSLDHISISTLQFILLKIALLIGVEVHFGVGFEDILKPCGDDETTSKRGWRAQLSFPSAQHPHPLTDYEFNVLLGADGRRNTLKGFKRKVLRAKLAIAITANFVNKRSAAEASVQEISGVSFIFKQDFFNELCQETGIDLENIVYYKDETHYFVMTAKKHSLLWKGVLYDDCAETDMLLSPDNVNRDALEDYVKEAVHFATDYKLSNLQFALNYRHEPDVALIDFTAMYAAENACRIVQRKGHKLLLGLVGDSLLEPFWPTGSGCARGFLSSLDVSWTIRSYAKGSKTATEVIAERESIYRLLAQTTHENLGKDFNSYTCEPSTRYPHINLDFVKAFQVQTLFDSDEEAPVPVPVPVPAQAPTVSNKPLTNLSSNQTLSVQKKNKQADEEEELEHDLRTSTSTTGNAPEKETENEDFPDLDVLLDWYKEQGKPYELKVDGIQDVFVHGNVLCAVLSRFRPDLLPEFPLPPEVQQGVDEVGQAAFRNQLAFDFIKGEYSIQSFVDGLDAILNVASNLSNLIDFSVKVYEMFKNEKPKQRVKSQINVTPTPQSEPNQTQTSKATNDSCTSSPEFSTPVPVPVSQQGYVSCVWTCNSNFLEGSGIDSDSGDSHSKRRVKRSSSIQRIVQRLDNSNSGIQSQPLPLPVRSSSFRLKKTNYEENQEERDSVASTSSDEIRRRRVEEAEISKVETLRLIHVLKTRQKEERDEAEERAVERERFIRSMRAEQQSEPAPETSTANFKTVTNDEFFNEYNMRLWRQSRPSIGERTSNLETKLQGAALERKTSFCELPARNKLRESLTAGLQRSATERHVVSKSDTLPRSVHKFRQDDTVVNSLGVKMAEGHGHGQVSVKTCFGQSQSQSQSHNKSNNGTGTGKQSNSLAPSVKRQAISQSQSGALSHSPSASHIRPTRKEIPTAAATTTTTTATTQKIPNKTEGLKKSSSVSCITKDGKTESPIKKKNDFSEYFKAKEAAIMKEQTRSSSKVSIPVTQAKSKVESKHEQPQPHDESKRKSVAEVKQNNKVNVNESIIKKTVRLAEAKSTIKPKPQPQVGVASRSRSKQNVNVNPSLIAEKAPYEMKPDSINAPVAVARQSTSTVEEFDTLFGITEADEEILAELNLDELNHLLDWTEKNFHVRRGVDTE